MGAGKCYQRIKVNIGYTALAAISLAGGACLALKLSLDSLVSNLDSAWCIESTFAQLWVQSTGKGKACES